MVWILRALNLSLIILAIWCIFFKPELSRIIFIFISFLLFISGSRKGIMLGLDSLRGRFWLILSFIGILFPISAFLELNLLHTISRFYIAVPLLLILLGSFRYGLSLSGKKPIIWTIGMTIVLFLGFVFTQFLPSKDIVNYFFVLALVVDFGIILAILLVYFGSELGLRWLLGALAFSFFFIGDPFYLLGYKEMGYLVDSFVFFFVNIAAQIED